MVLPTVSRFIDIRLVVIIKKWHNICWSNNKTWIKLWINIYGKKGAHGGIVSLMWYGLKALAHLSRSR